MCSVWILMSVVVFCIYVFEGGLFVCGFLCLGSVVCW